MHQEAWVQNFVNAGKSAANQTIPQIVEYMTTQGSLEPRTNKSTTPRKRDNDGSDRNDRNHGGRGQGRGFHTGGRGGRGRGGRGSGRGNGGGRNNAHSQQRGRNNERSTGRTDPNDPCPIHNGSHLWRKCVYNPNADSDAPQLRQYRNQQLSNPAGGRGQSDNRRVLFAPVNSYFVGQPTSYYMGPPTGTVVSGFGNPGGPNSSAGQVVQGSAPGEAFYVDPHVPFPARRRY
jgi:hypothetical protein